MKKICKSYHVLLLEKLLTVCSVCNPISFVLKNTCCNSELLLFPYPTCCHLLLWHLLKVWELMSPDRTLVLTGKTDNYELLEIKFKSFLETPQVKLYSYRWWCNYKKKKVYARKKKVLNDKSLNAPDDGRKALQILKDHFIRSSKPIITSLYCELKMGSTVSVTDYMLQAETYIRLKSVIVS